MAYARVITIGRNSDMPKVVRLPVGVGVDGAAVRAPVTIKANEMICPACDGWGQDIYDDTCERCDGRGIAQDTSAAPRCLDAAEVGRPVYGTVTGRPPTSGSTPAARATGELSRHNAERGTRSVLRSVPGSSASHRPAADMPPIALQGTWERVADVVTVLGGLAVFAAIGLFFLVLA